MAIALRGSAATPVGNPTTGFTVGIDSAVVAGDVGFITVASRDNISSALGPTISDNDTGGNAWAVLLQSSDGKATTWWKRATSGTANKTVTIASAVGSAAGVIKWFSGVDSSATPYSNAVQESNASADETHAGFTPGQANSMLCAAVINYSNDNGVTSLAFATAGATTATEKLSTGGSDCGAIFGHVLQSGGPSATGNLTWSQTDGTTYSHVWAIKPAANPVITADSGAVSITGTDAGLLYKHAITADSGAVAITGTDAGLLFAHVVAANSGAVPIAGTTLTLRADRAIALDSGAVPITGTDVGLLAARLIALDSGAVPISGQDAILVKGIRFVVDSGAVPVNGQDINLLRAYVVSLDAGVVPITGTDAGLFYARLMSLNSGNLPLSGDDVGLYLARLLSGDAGAIPISGTDLAFVYGRTMFVDSGAVPITGSSTRVLLGYDQFPPQGSGVRKIFVVVDD